MKKTKSLLILAALAPSFLFAQNSVSKEPINHSKTVPEGMKMVWNDEFNERKLDTSKWFTSYYSTLDYYYRTNFEDFRADNLPQPAMLFTDSTIILRTNDQIPERTFWESGRKISSIQTYDWNTNQNKMPDNVGGYFEARIRRSATSDAEMANSAFWFDSPGPDLRYYIEKGNTACDVEGIRPRGQVFEIDLCEYITTEIVLHGNVSPEGKFQRNIGHFIIPGQFNNKWTTHGMLWSPAGLKFYINGELVAESWDPNDIKSANHTMNMFFGAYGKGGEVDMEVDYVRYYQWELKGDNELPNPGFEYSNNLFPWEGSGKVTTAAAFDGNYGLELLPGEEVYQYVYLNHSRDYQLTYMVGGSGTVNVCVENIEQVSGAVHNNYCTPAEISGEYKKQKLMFQTAPEYGDHKRTVKVKIKNTGKKKITLDNIEIKRAL